MNKTMVCVAHLHVSWAVNRRYVLFSWGMRSIMPPPQSSLCSSINRKNVLLLEILATGRSCPGLMPFIPMVEKRGAVQDIINWWALVSDLLFSIEYVQCAMTGRLCAYEGLFRPDASVSIWRRKTQRACFGTHVSQSVHSDRPRRIKNFIQ